MKPPQISTTIPPLTLHIVGADYPNKRGPGRRFAIAMCRPGVPVELRPEPRNPADPRAIAVYSEQGVQLGYLTAERCGLIGRRMAQGMDVRAVFQCATASGAAIRVTFDGSEPVLPTRPDDPPDETPPDFWPDPEWPEEFPS